MLGNWRHRAVCKTSISGSNPDGASNKNIFVNGVYLLTYYVTTEYRSGQSGQWSGNTGGAVDNFKLSRLGGGKKK